MTKSVETDLETGRGIAPCQLPKRGPLPMPVPAGDFWLDFVKCALGFALGCVFILAVAGCFEFHRVAIKARTQADALDFQVSELQREVGTLKAWNDNFQIEIRALQKDVGAQMAVELKAEAHKFSTAK